MGATAKADFGDVRVKMRNTTNNDTAWDYKLVWVNATAANLTFTVNSDGAGNFNAVQKYFLVWGNGTNATSTSNPSLPTSFASAPTNWTFGLITGYAEGCAGIANRSAGIQALDLGIQQSTLWPHATVYQNQQVYLRDLNGRQNLTTVDRVVVYGNQRWLLNYSNATVGLFNITPVVYSLELSNMTAPDVQLAVINFIASTKQ